MISSFCWVTIIISLMDDNVPRYRISCIQLRLIVIMYEDSGEIVSSQQSDLFTWENKEYRISSKDLTQLDIVAV